jgi:uncharacterized protein YabN with tetrapyrrole methylase and pyrophosphatase domain
MSQGRLVVVGTGLITPQHITQEAKRHIQAADCVYHIVPDPLGVDYLRSLNSELIFLGDCYQKTDNRRQAYRMMAERIMSGVRQNRKVVAVFYGHPGVFVTPSHEAIRQARKEGYRAYMLPGISAEDCLFADLGIDPCYSGCQSHEATYFLIYKTVIDPASAFIIWQIGVVGDLSYSNQIAPAENGMSLLKQKLLSIYPADHRVAVYEAAVLPGFQPRIDWIALEQLDSVPINDISTLFIPAVAHRERDSYLPYLTN